jgi:AAHS family 4-hydroxybenzoate transporter-like MFS transporter
MVAQDRPVAARQWLILVLVLTALVIDGVDTQLLSLLSTLIMGELQTDKAHFGPAMSAALIGMTLGAGVGGWFGDRVGRKTVLVASTLLFGICTFGVAVTHSLPLLIGLRLASGLGFGAVAPNGAAMVSEWLPTRMRTRAMGLLSITIPLGGLVGGSAVLALLPSLGWRGCFTLCGFMTLAVVGLLLALLPESPAYLAARGLCDRAAALVLAVTGAEAQPDSMPAVARESVLTRANLRLNLSIWIGFFCLELIAYAFISWTPVLLTMAGLSLATAIQGTLVFNLSAVGASLLTALLLERFRFRSLVVFACLGAAAALVLLHGLIGQFPEPLLPLEQLAGIGLVSVLAGIAIAGVYTFAAFAYPAPCRANGIGITLMAGRAGGILSAFTGGILLSLQGNSTLPFFATLFAAALVAAISVLALGARYNVVLRNEGEAIAETTPSGGSRNTTPISAASR